MKNLLKRLLAISVILAMLTPGSNLFAATKTWTTDTDFNAGTKVGTKVVGTGAAASVELVLATLEPWYNTSWLKRAPVTVSNTSGAALADYQIKVNVTYDADMNPDFSDLRFTTDDKTTEIPYWLESKVDSTSAVVWVKVPSIPTGGTTIYAYYGNPGANDAQNGTGTFIDFSDFNDLSGWTQQLGTWTVSDSVLHTAQTVEQANALRRDTPLPTPPYILSYRHKVVNEKPSGARGLLAEANNPIVGSTSVMWVANTYSNLFYCSVDADWLSVAYNSAANTWYIGNLQIKSGDNIATIYSGDGASLLASRTNTANSAGTGHYFGFVMYASDSGMDVDWIFARKYASPEPTNTIGAEENKP